MEELPQLITKIFILRLYCALAAVTATQSTISSTEQPRDKSLAGLFNPKSNGPMARA
jgi:hypothetical protein